MLVEVMEIIKGKFGPYPLASCNIKVNNYRAIVEGIVIREMMEMTEVGVKIR